MYYKQFCRVLSKHRQRHSSTYIANYFTEYTLPKSTQKPDSSYTVINFAEVYQKVGRHLVVELHYKKWFSKKFDVTCTGRPAERLLAPPHPLSSNNFDVERSFFFFF